MSAFKTIMGQCSNVEEIGKGGQKTVYRADHVTLGRVAVKHGTYISDSSLERIDREVQLLRSLETEFFPKNFEFIVDSGNREFVILEEYLEAKPLTGLKDQFNKEEEIVALGRQIISAMGSIWDRRIIHRDLKPDNILITSQGVPKIIDFGIARFLDQSSLTKTVAFRGPATPAYAAPEQLLNQKNNIDQRTDFFAIGIILGELALKFHPFDPRKVGEGQDIPDNIENGRFKNVDIDGEFSSDFHDLIKRLLQVEPYGRFRTHAALLTFINAHWGDLK